MDEEHEATENSGPVEESPLFTDVESSVNAASDTICNGDIHLGEVIVECDDSQDAEEGRIARFVAGGCSCKLAGGSPCCHMFSAAEYRAMRDECQGLTHDELDLVVMGQLRAVTQRDELTQKIKASNSPCSRNINPVSVWWPPCVYQHLLFLARNGPETVQEHQVKLG